MCITLNFIHQVERADIMIQAFVYILNFYFMQILKIFQENVFQRHQRFFFKGEFLQRLVLGIPNLTTIPQQGGHWEQVDYLPGLSAVSIYRAVAKI